MLGRFGVEPPTYRHQQAYDIPLVSGIETTMAWLDRLAVRHGWTTDYISSDLINAGGFNWYRYTGGVGEKELFTPQLTTPFGMEGYPHNVSGIFDQFKAIETFVGYRLGQDWINTRWTSTYNGNSNWEEPNYTTNRSTDGVQPLFESGLKFGKWVSEGFNSPVYDGGPDDPDITWYATTLTKGKRFFTEIPWNIVENGPTLKVNSGDMIHPNIGLPWLNFIGIESGWVQSYQYKSSGQPLNGTVVGWDGVVENTVDATDTLVPGNEVYDYWGGIYTGTGGCGARKIVDFRVEAVTVSGYAHPKVAHDPVTFTVTEPVVWLSDPPPMDGDYPFHANSIVTSEVQLTQTFSWAFLPLRSQVRVPGDSFDDQVQYHNPQKLYGFSSAEGFPFAANHKWMPNLSDLHAGHMDSNSYYDSFYLDHMTGSGQVVVHYSSTHGLGYHAFNDRDIVSSGGTPIVYNLNQPGGLKLNDITFAISGFFKGEYTDLSCYTIPKMSGGEKTYNGYPIPDDVVVTGDLGAAFVNGINTSGNDKKHLGLLLYTKDPWEMPPEFPASGTVTDPPWTDSTINVLYMWSGVLDGDPVPPVRDPDYYTYGTYIHWGLSAGLRPWGPAYSHGVANSNGVIHWFPAGTIPPPGGAGSGFVDKNSLQRQNLNNYVPEIQNHRNPRFFQGFNVQDVPGIKSNRSSQLRRYNTGGVDADPGSEYRWEWNGSVGQGIVVGVDDAERTQPSGGTTYGFYV